VYLILNQLVRSIVEQLGTFNKNKKYNELSSIKQSNMKDFINVVAKEIIRHRVTQIAKYNISQSKNHYDFFNLLSKEINSKTNEYEKISKFDMHRTKDLLKNKEMIFIKGSALSILYPKFYNRDLADIDILISNFSDLWSVLKNTKKTYNQDRLKIYTYAKGEVSGSIDLTPKKSTDSPSIDIHISAFPIWGAIKYECDLWDRKIETSFGYIPSWEDSLLLIVAHVTKQWFYRLRDLNDIFVIINEKSINLDWNYIYIKAREVNLFDILVFLLKETQRVYQSTFYSIPKEFNSQLFKETKLLNEFKKKSWGESNLIVGAMMQTKFTFNKYREYFGSLNGCLHCMKNGINMLIYNNRAYSAQSKRVIRKLEANEILVLIPLFYNKKSLNRNLGKEIVPSLKIVNQNKKDEYFISPYCLWVQASYSGEISEDVKEQIIRSIGG
jgi:hypothetical protein